MGRYSIAVDSGGGTYQFKTGDDEEKRFLIGDSVPYARNDKLALDEEFADGVYEGISEKHGRLRVLVVIKDHILAAITPITSEDGDWTQVGEQYKKLRDQWDIKDPSIEEWSAEARDAYHRRVARDKTFFAARDAAMVSRFGADWQRNGGFIRMHLASDGIGRRIFGPHLTDVEMYAIALRIAQAAHAGQRRHNGMDYLMHPLAVAAGCTTDRARVLGVLHDTIEDTTGDFRKWIEREIYTNLSNRMWTDVWLLTRLPGEDYSDYIARIIDSDDCDIMDVKIQDITHNLLTTGPGHRADKYRLALRLVQEARSSCYIRSIP